MKRKMGFLQVLSTLAIGFFVDRAVIAEDHGDHPCAEDAKKICGAEKGEHHGVKKCLKEHQSELSSTCKAHVEQMKQEGHELKAACKSDHEKFCKDVSRGGGRVLKCLKQHEAELSEDCKREMAEMKEMRHRK